MKSVLKYTCILYGLTFWSQMLFSQSDPIDSLKLALKNAKHDTVRCNILAKLSETAGEKEWPGFNDELRSISEKNSPTATGAFKKFYLKHLLYALSNSGFLARQEGKIEEAIDYFNKSLKLAETIQDGPGIVNSLNSLAQIYVTTGEAAKALEYFNRSVKVGEETKDKRGSAYTINAMGALYLSQGNIEMGLEAFHKSLKIQEEINDKIGMGASFNNIGSIYSDQGDNVKALEYFLKS